MIVVKTLLALQVATEPPEHTAECENSEERGMSAICTFQISREDENKVHVSNANYVGTHVQTHVQSTVATFDCVCVSFGHLRIA